MKCKNCGREIIHQLESEEVADFWYHFDDQNVWCWDASVTPFPNVHDQATPSVTA